MIKDMIGDQSFMQDVFYVGKLYEFLPEEQQDIAIKSVLLIDSIDLAKANDEEIECFKYAKKLIAKFAVQIEENIYQQRKLEEEME